jgi:hypothetical protein
VKIENAEWLLAGGGAPPVLVEWEATPKVPSVTGKALNLVGEETCHTGAATGLQCGEILQVGVTQGGTENLIETSAKAQAGDSGAPEFARSKGGVLIQGTTTTGGGSLALGGNGNLTLGSNLITGFPAGPVGNTTCDLITEMQAMWPVPIEGKGIPAKTTVKNCEDGVSANIEMSAAATENGVGTVITVGHTVLSSYEPMSQIEAVYTGQTLLVK